MDAIVSGSANIAILLDDTGISSLRRTTAGFRRVPLANDLRYLLGDAGDLSFLDDTNETAVQIELEIAHGGIKALHLALMTCDGSTSSRAITLAVAELETLLQRAEVVDRVERVLDAKPIPLPLIVATAIARCHDHHCHVAAAFFAALGLRQSVIAEVRRAWDMLPKTLFADAEERAFADGLLAREGAFRSLVRARIARTELTEWHSNAVRNGALIRFRVERWLAPWLTELASPLPTRVSGPQYPDSSTFAEDADRGSKPIEAVGTNTMPTYLNLGIYLEEVDRGWKPIEAVRTNTVGFLGESSTGPLNEAVLVTNWSQFVQTFGDFRECSAHLAHALSGFFNNGGARCFVVNVGAPEKAKVESEPVSSAGDEWNERLPVAALIVGGDRNDLYIGRDGGPGARTGLKCFDEIDEIAIVCAPGQTSPAVQDALLSHCETRKDRFAILDSPETIAGGVDKLPKPRDSKYGAYYFPWIQVYDPDKGNIFVPPSGHVAGVYSRTDAGPGIHKAPANEIVRGALGLKYNISKGEQDLLDPKGVNAIRFMNGAIRLWGARTLSSDPSWRYINVRRLFIMVESSIERDTKWVVFEPNDQRLWKRVQRTLASFLTMLWHNGALMGTSPEQAFYVKCDDETNPPEVIDAGQLCVEIGLKHEDESEYVVERFLKDILPRRYH